MLFLWIVIFVISLAALVKGADWLILAAEKIGLSLGLSPFVVGALIIGLGTSFPELISSFTATVKEVNDVAVANVVGSNIANILLVVGISAIVAKKINITKNLIDLDLPLLALTTILLGQIIYDGKVSTGESVVLLFGYVFYLFNIFLHKEGLDEELKEVKKEKLIPIDFFKLIGGIALLALGSEYLINSLVNLSTILNLATGVITITAVAIGTSLPELLVSVKAAKHGKAEVALGNIFGSNIFNSLVVVGVPGLFGSLVVDTRTIVIGLPTMALATLAFVISGSSKRIYIWEGLFYLTLYVLFIAKLFNLF